MLFIYDCKVCKNSHRFLTGLSKEPVICKQCGREMTLQQKDITSSVQTTEEARFMADEALFNTIGDRVSKKHRVRHL